MAERDAKVSFCSSFLCLSHARGRVTTLRPLPISLGFRFAPPRVAHARRARARGERRGERRVCRRARPVCLIRLSDFTIPRPLADLRLGEDEEAVRSETGEKKNRPPASREKRMYLLMLFFSPPWYLSAGHERTTRGSSSFTLSPFRPRSRILHPPADCRPVAARVYRSSFTNLCYTNVYAGTELTRLLRQTEPSSMR